MYLILNEVVFTYSIKILFRLLTVNTRNCLTPKIRKCAFHEGVQGLGPHGSFHGLDRGVYVRRQYLFCCYFC